MRVNRGGGWVDLGPTAKPTVLPDDVRLPFKSNGIREFVQAGEAPRRYKEQDRIDCHVDPRPSELGESPEADVWDRSRHDGLLHYVHSQADAKAKAGESPNIHEDSLKGMKYWTTERGRDILHNVLDITLDHDCENHLAAGIEVKLPKGHYLIGSAGPVPATMQQYWEDD